MSISKSIKLQDIHTMECYLPVKKNKLVICASRMNLINIMLDIMISERCPTQKITYCMILFI